MGNAGRGSDPRGRFDHGRQATHSHFTAEHAVAVALQTNRAKDRVKILHLQETATTPLDRQRLESILQRTACSTVGGSSRSRRMGETPQKMLDRVLAAKQAYRRKLALLPFEEKILMVLQMQRSAVQLKQARRKP